MAQKNNFILSLDTSPPLNPNLLLSGGSSFTSKQLITASISTDSLDVFQMKLWGDVDDSHVPEIQSIEEDSSWISYSETQEIKLSTGDGSKTIRLKLRDNVLNVTSEITATISLDTTIPTVIIISSIAPNKISKIPTKNMAEFSFQADEDFTDFKVMVVENESSTHLTGTKIGISNGSSNMGEVGTYLASTPIVCKINGTDLELASPGDGDKMIKVFVKDNAGNWSI